MGAELVASPPAFPTSIPSSAKRFLQQCVLSSCRAVPHITERDPSATRCGEQSAIERASKSNIYAGVYGGKSKSHASLFDNGVSTIASKPEGTTEGSSQEEMVPTGRIAVRYDLESETNDKGVAKALWVDQVEPKLGISSAS